MLYIFFTKPCLRMRLNKGEYPIIEIAFDKFKNEEDFQLYLQKKLKYDDYENIFSEPDNFIEVSKMILWSLKEIEKNWSLIIKLAHLRLLIAKRDWKVKFYSWGEDARSTRIIENYHLGKIPKELYEEALKEREEYSRKEKEFLEWKSDFEERFIFEDDFEEYIKAVERFRKEWKKYFDKYGIEY